MALGAYVSGWFVKADPDLGRVVTCDVVEDIEANARPFTRVQPIWPDARPDNGEPGRGAVLVIVDAPDETHNALERLPNNKVVPLSPKSQEVSSIQSFVQGKGVAVDLASAATRKDVAGRVARALNDHFVDFTGPDAGL